jgi:20S proteasome subunit beta 2
VADKNCEKIHFIAPNIYCCGAGTAADTENVTGVLCYCCMVNSKVAAAAAAAAARRTLGNIVAYLQHIATHQV